MQCRVEKAEQAFTEAASGNLPSLKIRQVNGTSLCRQAGTDTTGETDKKRKLTVAS